MLTPETNKNGLAMFGANNAPMPQQNVNACINGGFPVKNRAIKI